MAQCGVRQHRSVTTPSVTCGPVRTTGLPTTLCMPSSRVCVNNPTRCIVMTTHPIQNACSNVQRLPSSSMQITAPVQRWTAGTCSDFASLCIVTCASSQHLHCGRGANWHQLGRQLWHMPRPGRLQPRRPNSGMEHVPQARMRQDQYVWYLEIPVFTTSHVNHHSPDQRLYTCQHRL